jgi:hypothetical protein
VDAEQEPRIWKVIVPGERDPAAIEELLGRAAIRQRGGTGLRIERADTEGGSTAIYVSGAKVDAETLLGTLGESRARRQKVVACTPEQLREKGKPRGRRR